MYHLVLMLPFVVISVLLLLLCQVKFELNRATLTFVVCSLPRMLPELMELQPVGLSSTGTDRTSAVESFESRHFLIPPLNPQRHYNCFNLLFWKHVSPDPCDWNRWLKLEFHLEGQVQRDITQTHTATVQPKPSASPSTITYPSCKCSYK